MVLKALLAGVSFLNLCVSLHLSVVHRHYASRERSLLVMVAPPSSSSSVPSKHDKVHQSVGGSSKGSRHVKPAGPYRNVFEELRENEQLEVMDMAFGDEHARELPRKVAKALEEDYDMTQGVNPNSRRPLPIKAYQDLLIHRAKSMTDFRRRGELYQRCISYNPTDGRAWLGLARIYSKKGQPERAEKTYKDGLYYSPKNPFLLQSWAVMLEKQGKLTEATKLLTRSIRSNPTHAASWVALAKIHQRTGRLEQARYCFSNACDGDPRSYVAFQAWGVLESNAGNVAKARDLFGRAWRASGNRSAHAVQALATLEKRLGNLDEAARLLEMAIKGCPRNSKVRFPALISPSLSLSLSL